MLTFKSYIDSYLLTEISKGVYDDVIKWTARHSEHLSFDNIFGDKYRIIVPYKNHFKELYEALREEGYDIDVKNNMARKISKYNVHI